MDWMGTIDAYAVIRQGKNKIKSKVDTMADGVVTWNQTMLIPVEFPIKDDKLIMEVWDEDKVSD